MNTNAGAISSGPLLQRQGRTGDPWWPRVCPCLEAPLPGAGLEAEPIKRYLRLM
jgi:hypothetical protein